MSDKENQKKRLIDADCFPEELLENLDEDLTFYIEKLKKEKKENLSAFHIAIKDMDIDDLDAIFGCYIT